VASFGFGSRRPYPEWMERNMKELPAPGAYELGRVPERKKGVSFGLGYQAYEKVLCQLDRPPRPRHESQHVGRPAPAAPLSTRLPALAHNYHYARPRPES
jgi:hypothetical protein